MSTDEKLTAFAFAVTVGLWIFGGAIGVNAVAAALTGLAILLITGAYTQKCTCECRRYYCGSCLARGMAL